MSATFSGTILYLWILFFLFLFVWFMCFMCVWCVYYVFYVYMGQVPEIKLMMIADSGLSRAENRLVLTDISDRAAAVWRTELRWSSLPKSNLSIFALKVSRISLCRAMSVASINITMPCTTSRCSASYVRVKRGTAGICCGAGRAAIDRYPAPDGPTAANPPHPKQRCIAKVNGEHILK